MKLAILGSTSITDPQFLMDALGEISRPKEIISNGAVGIGSMAQSYAQINGIPIKIIYQNKDEHGKGAVFKRDSLVLEESDLAYIFWDGNSEGTLNIISLCVSKRKPCKIVVQLILSEKPEKDILNFDNKNFWLNNMFPCGISVGKYNFPSVENAYYAAAFSGNADLVSKFEKVAPLDARKLSEEFYESNRDSYVKGFSKVKVKAMRKMLGAKFSQHEYLKEKLISTEGLKLINGNNWGEKFWGVCDEEGENTLGLILEQIRGEYLNAKN